MARPIIMPKLGQTMEQGIIVEWLVKEGDAVKRGDVLFQVESDKAVLEAESRYNGTLLKILVGTDVEVPVLTPVAVIGEPGEDISALLAELKGGTAAETQGETLEEVVAEEWVEAAVAQTGADTTMAEALETREAEEAAPAPERIAPEGTRIMASPRARRLAAQNGADLAYVRGSGPEGRIIEADVQAYLASRPAATSLARRRAEREGLLLEEVAATGARVTAGDVAAAAARAAAGGRSGAAPGVAPAAPAVSAASGAITPMRGVRGIIAERMAASAHTTAAITIHSEVDATELVALRERLRDALAKELGFNVGYNDLLGVIVARCLVEFPYMNVQLTTEGIRQMPEVNLGLAVDSERGLLVPVVRHADTLGIKGFAQAFRDLVERARTGKSNPDELTGGTFTITNLGMYGVDMFTPIINLPEAAILGVGRIRAVPDVANGQVVIRQKMWLSLTADHRLVDGGPAARFLQGIARYVESPFLLLA